MFWYTYLSMHDTKEKVRLNMCIYILIMSDMMFVNLIRDINVRKGGKNENNIIQLIAER